jgi:putative transposase
VEPFWSDLCGRDTSQKRARHLQAWPQWRWHLDEVFVRINGNIHYLWRAVDHEGEVLEAYVTKSRNRKAALRFLRKAMKRYGRPKTIVNDKLGSYRAALRTIGNAARQETGRWLNNRVENSRQPLRRRERAMQRFRQMGSLRNSRNSFIRTQSFQSGAPARCRIIVRRSSANVGALELF